jgi:hypothetical protein
MVAVISQKTNSIHSNSVHSDTGDLLYGWNGFKAARDHLGQRFSSNLCLSVGDYDHMLRYGAAFWR